MFCPWRANYFRIFFWSGLGIIFGFLLLCFSCFSAFLLLCFFAFLLLLLLAFSAFLLFCFSCFSAFLLFCFSVFPVSLLLCFSCFSCFSAFLLFLLLCLSAVLLLCVSLFLCFSAFLLLCFFFFALPALNTWFSCKMHFAQYLHPWVSHDQPSLENLQRNMWEEVLAFCFGGRRCALPPIPPPAFFFKFKLKPKLH